MQENVKKYQRSDVQTRWPAKASPKGRHLRPLMTFKTLGGSTFQRGHQAQHEKVTRESQMTVGSLKDSCEVNNHKFKARTSHCDPVFHSHGGRGDMEQSDTNPPRAVVWPRGFQNGEQTPLQVCKHGLDKGMHFHPDLHFPEVVSSTSICRRRSLRLRIALHTSRFPRLPVYRRKASLPI